VAEFVLMVTYFLFWKSHFPHTTCQNGTYVRCVVQMTEKMLMLAWVVMLCGFMGRNEHSERTNCLALKMETVCSSKMLVSTYKSTRYYKPEYRQDSTFLPYKTKPL